MEPSGRPKRQRVTGHIFDDYLYETGRSLRLPKKSNKRKMLKDKVKTEKNPFPCEHCSRSFKEEAKLLEHEEVHFKTEEVNECQDCGIIFVSKSSLLCHINVTHNGLFSRSGQFKCEVCNKTFLQRASLRTHFTIHTGEKPFKCEICDIGFRLNSSLKRHICKEHYLSKPYRCSQCGKDFGHNSDLMHHVRSVHATERNFVCQICGQKFTSNVVLMRHVNIHFELKLNKCKICAAKFSHSGSLYHHMKVHSNERAFHCQTCGKSYKLKSHLKNHNCTANLKQRRSKDASSSRSNEDDASEFLYDEDVDSHLNEVNDTTGIFITTVSGDEPLSQME